MNVFFHLLHVALDTRWNNFGLDRESLDFIRSSYDREIFTETKDCNMGFANLFIYQLVGTYSPDFLY